MPFELPRELSEALADDELAQGLGGQLGQLPAQCVRGGEHKGRLADPIPAVSLTQRACQRAASFGQP